MSGCAHINSIHRTTPLNDKGKVISVDAKQRFLITNRSNSPKTNSSNGNAIEEHLFSVCAEPSPDTFSTYSAAIEASADKAEQLTAALKLATGENSAAIGIRTQAIQLLRDAMYRNCEAFISGGITKEDYKDMLEKYQRSMVVLVAIEQLTQATQPSQLSISSTARAQASSKLFEAKVYLDKANSELADKQENYDESEVNFFEAIKSGGLGDPGNNTPPDNSKREQAITDANEKCESPDSSLEESCKKYKEAHDQKILAKTSLDIAKKDAAEWLNVYNNLKHSSSLSIENSVTTLPTTQSSQHASQVADLAESVENLVTKVFDDGIIEQCQFYAKSKTTEEIIESNIAPYVTPEGVTQIRPLFTKSLDIYQVNDLSMYASSIKWQDVLKDYDDVNQYAYTTLNISKVRDAVTNKYDYNMKGTTITMDQNALAYYVRMALDEKIAQSFKDMKGIFSDCVYIFSNKEKAKAKS